MTVHIDIRNDRELTRMLSGNNLLAGPWTQGMKEAGALGLKVSEGGAPVGLTGNLKASGRVTLHSAPVPLWAKVEFTAKREGGVSYGYILDAGARWGHKGWLSDVPRLINAQVVAILSRVAKNIERVWGR